MDGVLALQARGGLGFDLETFACVGARGVSGLDELDRDAGAELRVIAEPNRASFLGLKSLKTQQLDVVSLLLIIVCDKRRTRR